MKAWISRIVGIVAVVSIFLAPSRGLASISPHDDKDHRSGLHVTLTFVDGTTRTGTLQGVGCTTAMCSRVRARNSSSDEVWLDRLASVGIISRNVMGPVQVSVRLKDGTERKTSIIADNRILYLAVGFGRFEKLDLTKLSKIDFE